LRRQQVFAQFADPPFRLVPQIEDFLIQAVRFLRPFLRTGDRISTVRAPAGKLDTYFAQWCPVGCASVTVHSGDDFVVACIRVQRYLQAADRGFPFIP
jgi:hypothetical protein